MCRFIILMNKDVYITRKRICKLLVKKERCFADTNADTHAVNENRFVI